MTNLNQTCHECSLCGTLQRMSFWCRSKMQHGCQDQECILIGQKFSSQISRFDCDIVGIIIKWARASFEFFMSIKKPRWPLTQFFKKNVMGKWIKGFSINMIESKLYLNDHLMSSYKINIFTFVCWSELMAIYWNFLLLIFYYIYDNLFLGSTIISLG